MSNEGQRAVETIRNTLRTHRRADERRCACRTTVTDWERHAAQWALEALKEARLAVVSKSDAR